MSENKNTKTTHTVVTEPATSVIASNVGNLNMNKK